MNKTRSQPYMSSQASETSALLLDTHATCSTIFFESIKKETVDQMLSEVTDCAWINHTTLSERQSWFRVHTHQIKVWIHSLVFICNGASFTAASGWPCHSCCPFGSTCQLFKTVLSSSSLRPVLTRDTPAQAFPPWGTCCSPAPLHLHSPLAVDEIIYINPISFPCNSITSIHWVFLVLSSSCPPTPFVYFTLLLNHLKTKLGLPHGHSIEGSPCSHVWKCDLKWSQEMHPVFYSASAHHKLMLKGLTSPSVLFFVF